MDAALLAWLATEDGRSLLKAAEKLPQDRLTRVTRLRKNFPAELANAAVELLELRSRGRTRFANAGEMLFTRVGVEQATGDRIAKYRASRFPRNTGILDACCGIGGDAVHLARRGMVLAVDSDLASSVAASHNAALCSPSFPVRTVCADVLALDLARLYRGGFRAAFLDPSRRRNSTNSTAYRAKDSEEYSPPLSWLDTLRGVFPFVCAKVAPVIDDDALKRYKCAVEFVSDRGECKEALLWCGDFEGAQPVHGVLRSANEEYYSAAVIDSSGATATLQPESCAQLAVGPPAAWIYEPDAAVVRAHLTPVLGASLSAALLDLRSYYLTLDAEVQTPFASRYRLIEVMPLRPDDVQRRCMVLGRRVTAIKTRWTQVAPEDLLKRIPGAPKGADPVVIIVVRIRERMMALLCEAH